MSAETLQQNGFEYEIDKLLADYHQSVDACVYSPVIQKEMVLKLKSLNPGYSPIGNIGGLDRTGVLENVVSGIYAPIIHSFAHTVIKNIQAGRLSNHVIAPPRDAYPLAVALISQAKLQRLDIKLLLPYVNRNTAGIANNQKSGIAQRSQLLEEHLNQVVFSLNGKGDLTEVETGIYGTTSLVIAKELKERGIKSYVPVKLYGLGPNLSFVHAVLSGGNWLAEDAEDKGQVDGHLVSEFMIILDSMEELGMEKFYQSVAELEVCKSGKVKPIIKAVSDEERNIAAATNKVIFQTASVYSNLSITEVKRLITNVPNIVSMSQGGMPFTLKSAIPSMNSKEEHFSAIRSSRLFDYPLLVI